MKSNVFSTRPLDALLHDSEGPGEQSLRRALGPVNLVTLGIGAIIGAGIFVFTGTVAANFSGPAVVLSFILAAVGCVFAGLCYAEFASLIPIAGSAYTYGYATLGELVAWIIGWDLIIEYAVGSRLNRSPVTWQYPLIYAFIQWTLHMDLQLTGKLAVVTGGTAGIGRSVALGLAAEGCHIAICGRSEHALQQTANEVTKLGGRVMAAVADVTKLGEIEGFVSQTISEFGGVDLLVANVGGSYGAAFLDATPEEWRNAFDLNLFHSASTTRAVVPSMRERGGGSVVFVSSISGRRPVHRRWQYAAAKAALIHMVRCLALELAPLNIRVNSVSPGSVLVSGGRWEKFATDHAEQFDRFLRDELPFGRFGQPEEIADVIAFLLSPRASWISCADIAVDGAQGRPSAF